MVNLHRSLYFLLLLGSYLSQILDIKFTDPLPSDHILTKGDFLRIPLSSYVNLNGAQFTTSDTSFQTFVEQNLRLKAQIRLNQYTEMVNCAVLGKESSGMLAAVCNNQYLAIMSIDPLLNTIVEISTVQLVTTQISQGSMMCFDIIVDVDYIFISCWNRANKGDIVVFSVSPDMSVRSNKCTNTITGYLRMTRIMTPSTMNNPILAFFNVAPAVPSTSVGFTRCKLNSLNETSADYSNKVDVSALLGDTSSAVTLRHMVSLNPTELLFVLGYDVNGYREIRFAIINVDSAVQFTLSKYKIKPWVPASLGSKFKPNNLVVSVDLSPVDISVGLADMMYHFRLSLTFNKNTATAFYIDVSQAEIKVLDCGLSQTTDKYASRLVTQTLNRLDKSQNRQLIEYRLSNNDDFFGFGILFGGTAYACSWSIEGMNNRYQSAIVLNPSLAVAFVNTDMMLLRVSPDTILNINTRSMTAGNISIGLSARMYNYNPGAATLGFHLCENSTDYAKFDLQTKTFRSFQDGKFEIPVASANFLANDPKFTFNESSVKVYHTQTFTPTTDVDLTGEYKIDAIYSVDFDTYLAVLKSPGQGEKYVSLFANQTTGSFVLTKSSQSPQMPPGQTLFRTFKIGDAIYCIVFKALAGSVANKLSISCFEDVLNGKTLLSNSVVTNYYEVDDLQTLDTPDRSDMFMVGTFQESGRYIRKVLHYFVQLMSDGTITTSTEVRSLDISTYALKDYYPTDLMFDYLADEDGANHLIVKMLQVAGMPLVAKFALSFDAGVPSLKYLRSLSVDRHDVGFCVAKNEVIVLNRKGRSLYALQFPEPNGIPSYSQFIFPLKDYNVSDVIQLNCIPEKAMFQVLALTNTSKKILMTFRGGESKFHPRRVHSVVDVPSSVTFLESGLQKNYIITVAGSPGDNSIQRPFVITYTNGPDVYVDNTNRQMNYSVLMTMTTAVKTLTETLNIEIVQPSIVPYVQNIGTMRWAVGSTSSIDYLLKITGPMMDVGLSGNPTVPFGVRLTQRLNRHRGFSTGEVTAPNKLMVEKDFLVMMQTRSVLKAYGDPVVVTEGSLNPTLFFELRGSVRDFGLVRHGTFDQAALVYKVFLDGMYEYGLVILSKVREPGSKPLFKANHYPKLLFLKEDYEEMQVVSLDGADIAVALKSKNQLTNNFIKLVNFKCGTEGYVLGANTNVILRSDRPMISYSFVSIGSNRAALISSFSGVVGIQVAIWDGYSRGITMVQSSRPFDLGDRNDRIIPVGFLRCFPISDWTIECIADLQGVQDLLLRITIDSNYEFAVGGEFLKSVTKVGEFELPPLFQIKKASKGREVYGFLLERTLAYQMFDGSSSRRRVLQAPTIDQYSKCSQIIVTYKPQVSRFIYAGLTCSQWYNTSTTDFDLEEIGGRDYVFFGKPKQPKSSRRLLQMFDVERIVSFYISTPVLSLNTLDFNPSDLKINFIGLNGVTGPDNVAYPLSLFKPSNVTPPPVEESTSWAKWVLIVLICIAVLGILGVAVIYLKDRQTEPGPDYTRTSSTPSSISSSAPKAAAPKPKPAEKTADLSVDDFHL